MPLRSTNDKRHRAKRFGYALGFLVLAAGCGSLAPKGPKNAGEGAGAGALAGAGTGLYASLMCGPFFALCAPVLIPGGAVVGTVGGGVWGAVNESSAVAARPSPIMPAYFPAGIVEQTPKLQDHGCAPFNARAGSTYQHEDGRKVAIIRIVGESPQCPGARPLAVEHR